MYGELLKITVQLSMQNLLVNSERCFAKKKSPSVFYSFKELKNLQINYSVLPPVQLSA
jgi:hypothetical protein